MCDQLQVYSAFEHFKPTLKHFSLRCNYTLTTKVVVQASWSEDSVRRSEDLSENTKVLLLIRELFFRLRINSLRCEQAQELKPTHCGTRQSLLAWSGRTSPSSRVRKTSGGESPRKQTRTRRLSRSLSRTRPLWTPSFQPNTQRHTLSLSRLCSRERKKKAGSTVQTIHIWDAQRERNFGDCVRLALQLVSRSTFRTFAQVRFFFAFHSVPGTETIIEPDGLEKSVSRCFRKVRTQVSVRPRHVEEESKLTDTSLQYFMALLPEGTSWK